MAKKDNSIPDLIRQEAQKGTNSEDKTVNNNENEIIDVPAVEAIEVEVTPVVDEVIVIDKTSEKRTTNTKAELETTVTQLQAALDTAKENEVTWQKEVEELRSHLIKSQQNEAKLEKEMTDLRSELDSQKKLLKQQEQKLEKTNQMKKELDEAKQTSLQLANANSAIEEEVKQLRKQLEDLQPKPAPLPTKPAPLPVKQIRKEGKHLHFPSQKTDNSDDFASNTWLLD
ncbi:hypothetical protein [Floridanema evergladense]|uniref:Chromosome partition protein Smc n=1 Tax=Floridaenema evergladense BLCC-F167 TaxID=3153639 RepID=A0ABV4WQW8_9CYAN